MVEVADLEKAASFYSRLLGTQARPVAGERLYFDCGAVILATVKPHGPPTPIPQQLYFAVGDIEAVHARAQELGCLSKGEVHGESAAGIVKRPWGERSFYATDPFGNNLCFVDDQTLFTAK